MYGTLRHTHRSWLQRAAGDFYVYVYIQIRVLGRMMMNVCMYGKLCTIRHAYGTDRHKHAYRQLLRVHVDTDTRFKLYDNECNKTVRTELTERNQSFLIVEKTFGRYKTSILVINWAFRRDKTRRFNTRGVVLISFRFLSFAIRQQNRRS